MPNIDDVIRDHRAGKIRLDPEAHKAVDRLITEIKRLRYECGRDQRNAAKSQSESSDLLTERDALTIRVRELTLRHIGCLPVLGMCRSQVTEDLRDKIDHALRDASTIHPTMDITQMKTGSWWIEPRR